MFKRLLLIGLLGISLGMLFGNEAKALCTPTMRAAGYCHFYTCPGVECYISSSGLGNVTANPVFLGCTVHATGDWMVACGNPGVKIWTSPGINVYPFEGTLEGTYQLKQKDVDKNGNAHTTVFADPSGDFLRDLVLAGACPNKNWEARDAVPCVMTATDLQIDENGCVEAEAVFDCTLSNCKGLQWDVDNQAFERRQYDCVRTSYTKNNCP